MDNRNHRQNQESNHNRSPQSSAPLAGGDRGDGEQNVVQPRIGGRQQRVAQELYRPPHTRRMLQNVNDGRINNNPSTSRPTAPQQNRPPSIGTPYASFNFYPLNNRSRPNHPRSQNNPGGRGGRGGGRGGGHRFSANPHAHHQYANPGANPHTVEEDDGNWRNSRVRSSEYTASSKDVVSESSDRLPKVHESEATSHSKESEKSQNAQLEDNLRKIEFVAADDAVTGEPADGDDTRFEVVQKYDLINVQEDDDKAKPMNKRNSLEGERSKTSFAELAKRVVVPVKNDAPANVDDASKTQPKMRPNSVLTNIGGIVKIRMPQSFSDPRGETSIGQSKFVAKEEMPARIKLNETLSTGPDKSGGLIRLNLTTMQSTTMKNDDDQQSKYDLDGATFKRFETMLASLRQMIKHNRPNEIRHTDPDVWSLRLKIMYQCEQFLLSDLGYLTIGNALSHTWECCFYEFIKLYRMDTVQVSLYQQHKANLIQVETYNPVARPIDEIFQHLTKEGLNYFESLYRNLLKRYDVTYRMLLERHKFFKIDSALNSFLHDCTYVVKIIFIYTGDLWRYIENNSHNNACQQLASISLDGKAASSVNSKFYYMRAHMLVPKNGHICSQLALVSFYQKNYLDAIYFYMIQLEFDLVHDRCAAMFWSKSVKFTSNRQNLTVFFDYAQTAHQRLWNAVKNEHQEALDKSKCLERRWQRGHSRINKNYRMEYWIQPDNLRHISKCDMYNFYDLAAINTNECEPDVLEFYRKQLLPKYSFEEVKYNFMHSFLSVHGMLNYRAGLDGFYDVCNQMVLEYERLLALSFGGRSIDRLINSRLVAVVADSDQRISAFFLIQLMLISMYSVINTHSDNFQDSASYGFTHSNSYFTMATLISIILKRLIKTFRSFLVKHEQFMQMFISDAVGFAKRFQKVDVEPQSVEDLFGSILNTMSNDDELLAANPKHDGNGTDEPQYDPNEWIEFCTLLPCCKMWCDWVLSFNPYFPPQALNDIKTDIEENVWQILAEFLTLINKFVTRYPVEFHARDKTKNSPGRYDLTLTSPDKDPDLRSATSYELLRLPEDYCLEGFNLLNDSTESSRYVKKPFVPEIAYIYMRLETIRLTGDYLRGLATPVLSFDRENCQYRSCVEVDSVENKPGLKLQQIQQKQLLDRMNRYKKDFDLNPTFLQPKQANDFKEEEIYSDEEEALEEIKNLDLCPTERRKLLQYRMFRKQSNAQGQYFKIVQHIKESKRRFVIIPKYVVFDTNCFLNDLQAIKRLARHAPFTVTVPLIVVQELQYIANRAMKREAMWSDDIRAKNEAELKRLKQLSAKAEQVLVFLHKVFQQKQEQLKMKTASGSDDSDDHDLPYKIKAVTSKGHLLDRIDFKEDFYDPNAYNNDDLVLYACDYLACRDNNRDTHPTDEAMHDLLESGGECFFSIKDEYVYRDVVMVTDDMNLRLKSLGYDIPVKKLKQFLQWTNSLKKPEEQQQQQQ